MGRPFRKIKGNTAMTAVARLVRIGDVAWIVLAAIFPGLTVDAMHLVNGTCGCGLV